MLTINIKPFSELTTTELYAVLQLRSEVFVVEQDCVYQDLDGNDKKAIHILGYKANKLVGYTRVFKPGDYFTEACIGRVVVRQSERHHKYGEQLMKASIKAVKTHFKTKTIKISAQRYLETFYGNLGFQPIGLPYLEDGLPHIAMLLN